MELKKLCPEGRGDGLDEEAFVSYQQSPKQAAVLGHYDQRKAVSY